ncbi:MAG: hypothetical protein PHC59_10720 [Thomasclavelia ramosa]|nr:hypothetical protein [Thomasclavelia ramosa]
MEDYLYDYTRTYFQKKNNGDNKKYYFRLNSQDINVSEEVFKLCKSSYNKIRYHYKTKVDRSIFDTEDIDQSTFFAVDKEIETDIIRQILINDLARQAIDDIMNLSSQYKDIAICLFIKEMSLKETSDYLHIPKTTVFERRREIQKILQKRLKNPNDI